MKHQILSRFGSRLIVVYFIVSFLTSTLFSTSIMAADELRGETYCYPTKDLVKIVKKLDDIDASRRDIVDVTLKSRFIIKDGGVWPERFYLRTEAGEVTDVPISRETGAAPGFIDLIRTEAHSDICTVDPTRAERSTKDEGLYFESGLAPLFHNHSGEHSLDELKAGEKDGKKFYKKMVPDMLAMFVPDPNWFAVRYAARDIKPQIFARTEAGDTALTPELFKDMWVVSRKQIQKAKGTALIIKGGDYRLQPTVSPDMMRGFGWGKGNADDEGED